MELSWYFWIFATLACTTWILLRYLYPDRLQHLSGPRGIPFFGNGFQIDRHRLMLSFHSWAKTYGGLYRIRLPVCGDTIVVSHYQDIRNVLIDRGNEFAGRMHNGRVKHLEFDVAVTTLQPDDTWRHIRKLSHRYLKQFGDGMSRLERNLLENADYMLERLGATAGNPVNTLDIIRETALRSISVLLLGRGLNPEHPLHGMLLKYERSVTDFEEMSLGTLLVDLCPALMYLPLPVSKEMWEFKQFQNECWEKIKELISESETESLSQILLQSVSSQTAKRPLPLEEKHAKMASMTLIFAGVGTTSRAVHFIVNTLAFRQDMQQKAYSEIVDVLRDEGIRRVSVACRSKMPYLRATILECIRVFTVTPVGGIPHVAVRDVNLPGRGVIPKGTVAMINLWTLHHDETFWKDPDVIRPERFLDNDGQLVPPDHPNRKHTMPFGAGPRVCLGEVFAMTRIFLWVAAVIHEFQIMPSATSDEKWLNCNAHFNSFALLHPLPNEVVLLRRKLMQ